MTGVTTSALNIAFSNGACAGLGLGAQPPRGGCANARWLCILRASRLRVAAALEIAHARVQRGDGCHLMQEAGAHVRRRRRADAHGAHLLASKDARPRVAVEQALSDGAARDGRREGGGRLAVPGGVRPGRCCRCVLRPAPAPLPPTLPPSPLVGRVRTFAWRDSRVERAPEAAPRVGAGDVPRPTRARPRACPPSLPPTRILPHLLPTLCALSPDAAPASPLAQAPRQRAMR